MHHHRSRWQFERKISLPLLSLAAAQFVTLVAWATYLEARVTALESSEKQSAVLPERMARLEERLEAVRQDTAFIRRKLER